MSTQTNSFFLAHSLPVFAFLSDASKQQLVASLESGNRGFKERRLLDFFQALDWLPFSEVPQGALKSLSSQDKKRLIQEVQHYLNQQAEQKQAKAAQRKHYQISVFEYFRRQVPPADKALLESLRDFELDLTGKDLNWQHYFKPNSYKRIDQFIQADTETRRQWVMQFQQDVLAYRKNAEKWAQQEIQEDSWDFDAWCDTQDKDLGHKTVQNKTSHYTTAIQSAFSTLSLPEESTWSVVKQTFRQLTLTHHPDLKTGNTETMKAILSAYEALKQHFAKQ